ncbi:MAG: ABC transporter permease subunit [Campylobacteraceae bacterium]|nr:ABC transporter permease subunit [Campylobacteraceae bacterium]
MSGVKSKIKPFLLTLSALSGAYAIFAAFWNIAAFITLVLISALLALIALNAEFKNLNAKTALFALASLLAVLGAAFVFTDIKISITLTAAAGVFSLIALNINAFNASQITINIILLLIILFILLSLYANPNNALAWVSLVIFSIIAALVNRVGYKKANPKLPGFGISLGLSLTYMSFLILIPLSALVLYGAQTTWGKFWETLSDPRITAALKISFGASFTAALINCFFGLIIAWVLTRYDFWGKRVIDSIIDLPFAVPTAVAGISLAYIFSPNGVLGNFLQLLTDKIHSFAAYFKECADGESCFSKVLENADLNVAYSTIGIVIALVFIGLPFIVRTVQPVIEELDKELEEAASSLGANFYQIFRKVIFPTIYPALLTGFALAFARGLGEYGSVIFISSNMPYESEIVPLLIVKKLTQFDYIGASVIGVIMLIAAFILLLLINFLQSFAKRRKKGL